MFFQPPPKRCPTTGAIPWLALSERFPRETPDLPPPVKAVVEGYGPIHHRIRYEWDQEYNWLWLSGRNRRVAFGVVLDILVPLVWRELARIDQSSFIDPLEEINLAPEAMEKNALVLDRIIAQLRSGEVPSLSDMGSLEWLRNLTDSFHGIGFGEIAADRPTDDILAWSSTITDIVTTELLREEGPSSLPEQASEALGSAFIPIAYYLYYDVMRVPERLESEGVAPEPWVLLPYMSEDVELDSQYFTDALSWAIQIWWKEFLDALAFIQ